MLLTCTLKTEDGNSGDDLAEQRPLPSSALSLAFFYSQDSLPLSLCICFFLCSSSVGFIFPLFFCVSSPGSVIPPFVALFFFNLLCFLEKKQRNESLIIFSSVLKSELARAAYFWYGSSGDAPKNCVLCLCFSSFRFRSSPSLPLSHQPASALGAARFI